MMSDTQRIAAGPGYHTHTHASMPGAELPWMKFFHLQKKDSKNPCCSSAFSFTHSLTHSPTDSSSWLFVIVATPLIDVHVASVPGFLPPKRGDALRYATANYFPPLERISVT